MIIDSKNQEIKNKINNIINSDLINFSKNGWGVKLGKELHVSSARALIYLKKLCPKFHEEKCFKHKN